MKKISMIAVLFLISIFSANCQLATLNWVKNIGGSNLDKGESVAVDILGDVYITGEFSGVVDFDPSSAVYNLSASGGLDVFVLKFDAVGNFIWARKIGGSGGNDISNSINVDKNGNVYITGDFYGTADFDPGVGTYNLTATGGIFNIYISKLDSSGNFVWAKNIEGVSPISEFSFSISVDSTFNVYSTGYFEGTVDFDPSSANYYLTSSASGQDNIFILKLNSYGDFVWVKSFGKSGYNCGASIAIDAVGNIFTTGKFFDNVDFDPGLNLFAIPDYGGNDIYISKLDSLGNFVWAKSIGSSNNDEGVSIDVDAFSNVYITGYFQDTADFDPSPNTLDLVSEGKSDVFITKLDFFGDLIWTKIIGGTGYDYGKSISVDELGNVYTTGYFEYNADFDPGPNVYSLSSVGLWDIFISKLDSSGNFVWAKSFGGSNDVYSYSIAVDKASNIYTTGFFTGVADFDPDTSIYNLTSFGSWDIFIHKMSQSITSLNEEDFYPFKIYPNPTNDVIYIHSNQSINGTAYQLSDLIGRVIEKGIIKDETSSISLQGLSSGTYLLSIGDEIRKTLKVIKD